MPQRVLVLSPHPDDEAIGCGGTLRKHVLDDDRVQVIFLTSGEKGGHSIPVSKTGKVREQEAREATKILGISEVAFWRLADGELRATQVLTNRVVEYMTQYTPDIVYVPNEKEMHADHRATARLIHRATKIYEGNPRILMFEVWTLLASFDEIVDITPYLETKIAAIRAYKSQCGVLRFDEACRGLARYRGELFCWPKIERTGTCKYAEVFSIQCE